MTKDSTTMVDLNALAQQAADEEAARQQAANDEFTAQLQRTAGPIILAVQRMMEQRDMEGLQALAGRASATADERVVQLQRENSDLRGRINQLQRERDQKVEDLTMVQRQLGDKNTEIENLRNQIGQRNATIEELQNATREMESPRRDPNKPGWRERLGFEPR
jgi:chromosome segregation ATPase